MRKYEVLFRLISFVKNKR